LIKIYDIKKQKYVRQFLMDKGEDYFDHDVDRGEEVPEHNHSSSSSSSVAAADSFGDGSSQGK
jgi:hypothetical protein